MLLIDNLSDKVVYVKTLTNYKGLSFQGYDRAFREATTGLSKSLEEVADDITKAIL